MDDDVTEADIDTILASAKNLTKEREAQKNTAAGLEEKAKRDLLDFSDASVNFQVRGDGRRRWRGTSVGWVQVGDGGKVPAGGGR